MKVLSLLCAALVGVVLPAHAQTCVPLSGSIKLTPDLSCQISQRISGVAFLGAPGTCFSVAVKGVVSGSGFAGMTLEQMISPMTGNLAQSPAILNESGLTAVPDEFNLPETRRIFNARSALSLPGGTVYTIDMGIAGAGSATEQLIISGGEGLYKNATGVLYAYNNVLGQWSPYQGKLCLPF